MPTADLQFHDDRRRQADIVALGRDCSDALVVCDAETLITYVNVQAERLLGTDGGRIIGLPFSSLLRLETADGVPVHPTLDYASPPQTAGRPHQLCMLVRDDGQRLELDCEMIAIAPAAVLVRLSPRETKPAVGSLAYRATHDGLTGLPNRSHLQDRLAQLHRGAEMQRDVYSVLLLDLDHFKTFNDRFGHATGDQVLCHVGNLIAQSVRDMDVVGRWGGEEFLCLLPHVDRCSAEEIAERVRAGIELDPVRHNGRRLRATTSIGVATYPDDGVLPDAVLAKADAALYEAKHCGRNRVRSVSRHATNVFALSSVVEKALTDDRVRSAYQSVIDLETGRVCGAEALARIQLDDRQFMEAAYFIPAAEKLHLVHRIDYRVIRSAIMRCVTQAMEGDAMDAMFVNFSADFLRHPDLVSDILEIVRKECSRCGDRVGQIKPLVIEIAERQFKEDMAEAAEILKPFLDMGIRLAIDDFGAGYSSLRNLAELPVSFIKLEGELVRRVPHEPRVHAIVQGIQDLAADLGLITVAEGIEDAETLEAVKGIGVNWGQGYHFSRPQLDF